MTSEVLIVQVVQFFANNRCLADPSLFRAVRDIAQGWKDKGLIAQYWGTAQNQANDFYWLLLWQSHAHATAIKADPVHPVFVQKRQALASKPVYDVHFCFPGNASTTRRTLDAPVTEIDIYRTQEDGAAETHAKIRRVTRLIESFHLQGFLGLSWGLAVDDGTRGVYFGGWKTIEDHMRLGTADEHQVFVKECEEIFANFRELSVAHVYFKPHEA